MEIYKNKASGKNFIYINDIDNDKALFVTPQNEIKSLEVRFFDEPEKEHEGYLLSHGLITAEQVERCQQYEKNRSEDRVEQMRYLFEQLLPYEKKMILEKWQKE